MGERIESLKLLNIKHNNLKFNVCFFKNKQIVVLEDGAPGLSKDFIYVIKSEFSYVTNFFIWNW